MDNIFENFDESIGVDGYYQIIRNKLFPLSTKTSIDGTAFPLQGQTFRKGSVFSRVRPLSFEKVAEFREANVKLSEFYPPNPKAIQIPQGRFNGQNTRTLYLADHPFVAMKECAIEDGQYFFLSYIKLRTDMHFVSLEKSHGQVAVMLRQLLSSKDVKFYSLINKINDELLKFEGFQGISYNSVKVSEGHTDQTWGAITSTKNIAMSGEYIKNTELAVSWICYCDEDYKIYQHDLFRPLSNKKKGRLTRVSIGSNKSAFICASKKIMDELNEGSKRTRLLLDKGYFSELNQSPVKFIYK